jgi:hypothetical protein
LAVTSALLVALPALALPPRIKPNPDEEGALKGLWSYLAEIVQNHEPSPLAELAAEWAAELPRRFDFEPPLDGWISIDFEDDDEGDSPDG